MSFLEAKEVNLEALNKAIDEVMYGELNSTLLYYLQSCVNCKACEAACPFVPTSLKYSPVNKAEISRQLYRSRFTIWGKTLGKIVGGSKKYLKLDEAETMVDYVWHCTNCGACMFVCPMGIDSGALIDLLKKIAFKAGMAPKIYTDIANLEISGEYLNVNLFMNAWNSIIQKIKETIGRDIPLDKKGSEILFYTSIYEVMVYPEVIVKVAKILDMLKKDWTFMSKPLGIRPPIGIVIGDEEGALKVMERVYSYFKDISPKYVLLTAGGFEYPSLRYTMPETLGIKPSYEVLHVTELLAKWYENGEFTINPVDEVITWHDPCQLGRRGGVFEAPRVLMKALSRKFKELPSHGVNSFCCSRGGGGCGVPTMVENMAKALGINISEKDKSFLDDTVKPLINAGKIKVNEINKIKAKEVLTGCPVCIETIGFAVDYYHSDSQVKHIIDLLADRIQVKK
ncbi:4Fe-4S dicluster domain-containing protein [Acidianus sulfidivorans JP7]|uniref:4Fe-4S ferredoxin-type domain-containing protein n=1 Tax=Acidianus sulfidivorans JP7 TaxID=619593 RepID=A0A2U9ILD2_9CREN|nr:(Fe-S)-binding protein [Acidianus sulfidivorans]AWR96805.1 4Fe-4S dicluster domain-containing protein [Acidianus sulfidivorans JP7]